MPRTGMAYAGCYLFSEPYDSQREYIEVSLISGLTPKTTYYVEFYVSLGHLSKYGISNIGAHFSKDIALYGNTPSWDPFVLEPQIEYNGPPITDSLGWTKISGYYRPEKDGISYMTIGNFRESDSTNYQFVGYNIGFTYYYIDDVLVIDSSLVSLEEQSEPEKKLKLFPNPAQDQVNISLQDPVQGMLSISILDLAGRTILLKEYDAGQEISLPVFNLEKGLYIICVGDEEGTVYTEKLLVQ